MLLMADKKPSKRGRPRIRAATVVIQVRVTPEMGRALSELARQSRRSRNTELVIALEDRLKANNLWPPPAKPDATS